MLINTHYMKEPHVTVSLNCWTRFNQSSVVTIIMSCLAIATVAGCGNDHPVGTVQGTVTFKDKPLTEGILYVYNRETAEAGEGKIADGKFKLLNELSTGTYVAYVTAIPPPPPNPENPPANLWGKFPKDLPAKYQREDLSDLRIEVKEGANDVKLTIASK